jgi:PadR family transcriptional regulator, regulatory protein PadR
VRAWGEPSEAPRLLRASSDTYIVGNVGSRSGVAPEWRARNPSTERSRRPNAIGFLRRDDRMPLGEFEQVVLFAIARRRGEAHGAAIVEEIETRAGRRVSPGALYTVLDRLEAKGMVQSWIGDSTPERGGRRRKVHRLMPEGARQLRASYQSLQKMASGALARLDELAGDEG